MSLKELWSECVWDDASEMVPVPLLEQDEEKSGEKLVILPWASQVRCPQSLCERRVSSWIPLLASWSAQHR